jgi:hypothetical protein
VVNTRRQVEFGLDWYRNRPTKRYKQNEIPPGEHIAIAREGSLAEVQRRVPGRKVIRIGGFKPQKLEYFYVSAPGAFGTP